MATMADVLIRLMDFFARNRARFGVVLLGAIGAAMESTQLHNYPWVVFLLATVAGGLGGAGKFKSDQYQREEQGLE